jgi:hypothetical protein
MSVALIGVLIGAVATLAGSAVQLWFSARQRERDRHMQLRRDVYLGAAEGLAGFIEYLNQHARADIPFGKAALPVGAAGWLLKTYRVAGTDTLIAFNEASAAVATAAIDMTAHRLAVQQADDEIAVERGEVERIQRFMDDMLSEIKAADTEHPTETTLKRSEWAAEQHSIANARLVEELAKLDELTSEHARRLKTLMERSIRINTKIQKPIRAALLAARSELELKLDAGKYGSAAAELDMRMSAKVQELIDLIEIASK